MQIEIVGENVLSGNM